MENQIIKKLFRLRESMEKEYKGFPKEYCQISSRKIEENFGFPQVFGLFIDNEGKGYGHYWNSTSEKDIVDVTADQFSKKIPKIYILKENSFEAKEHYLENIFFFI